MENKFKIDAKPKVIKFDNWMDIKKESFGGPKEAIEMKKGEGGQIKGWQNPVKRNKDSENGAFNQNQDGFWKAVAAERGEKPELSEKGKAIEKEQGKAKSSMEEFLKDKEKESN